MTNFKRFYNELNSDQKRVVDMLEGPLLVLAGPGTGKTQLLSVRAANIIQKKKALPENILILTYTNAASKTMKERLAKTVGLSGYDVEVGTFHSFANSIILDSEEAANYIQERIQITDIEKVKAIEYILDHTEGILDIRPFNAPYSYADELQKRISELKREGVSPQEFLDYVKRLAPDGVYIEEKHIPRIKALAIIYSQYEKLKEGKNRLIFDSRGRYDFDDMIMIATEALNKEPDLKKKYQGRFKYIMVDEFQDTNGAQLKFLFSLIEENPNLCCVGDDDQAIYRFQGASIGNFKTLKERFPDLLVVSLKDNYRSAREIIELSSKLISEIPSEERAGEKDLRPVRDFRKKLIEYWEFTTEEEELNFIVEKIGEFKKEIETSKELTSEEKKRPYNNIAILVRKRDLILKVIDKFQQAGIPYATDGKEDIRPEKRVKQMLDVLELASLAPENLEEKDMALYKVLIADYFEIPYSDTLRLLGYVRAKKKTNHQTTLLSEFLNNFEKVAKEINFENSAALVNANRTISQLLTDAQFKPVHTILMSYVKDAGIDRYILREYDKNEVIRIRELRALSSFINMVKDSDFSNPAIGLKDFIDELRIRNEHDMPIQGELVTLTQDGVRIFTVHGSKGQEFHSVIIPFCLQDKSWPIKVRQDIIPLPPELYKTTGPIIEKERLKELNYYDETRLFYVAMSRTKCNLLFTATPQEDVISSSYIHRLGLERKIQGAEAEERILLKSIEKAKEEDPIIGSEAVLKDLVRDLALNPTSLNNYLVCRRLFFYDNVLMLPGAKKQSLIFGNAVHSALENIYRVFIQTDIFPDYQFFKERFLEALRFQGPEKAVELRCIEQFEALNNFFKKISSNPIKPIGLENRMPVNIDGILFTGKYDKLEMEDEKKGLVRVIDYKTGQPNRHAKGIFECRSLEDEACDEYLRQIVCYKLLFERDKTQRKGLRVSHGVLVFVEPAKTDTRKYNIKKGEPTEFKIEITEDLVDEMTSIIKNTYANIQKLHFEKLPERDRDKCGVCDFDYICW